MFKQLVCAFLLLAIWAGCREKETTRPDVKTDNPLQSDLDRTVDNRLRPLMKTAGSVGAVVGIYQDGKTTFYGYGETARGSGQLPGRNHIFEIGSITKTFTAALVATWLREKGLSPDSPTAPFLPKDLGGGLTRDGRPLTFRQLLDYSSGLPEDQDIGDLTFGPGFDKNQPYRHYDSTRIYNFIKTNGLKTAPGTTYIYSNMAFGLAGLLLERSTGKPFAQLMTEKILKPMGLNDTGVTLSADQQARRVKGYDEKGNEMPYWDDLGGFDGAGVLTASPDDMLKFAQAHLRPPQSDLEKTLLLTRRESFRSGSTVTGLGWQLTDPAYEGVLKTGGTGGFSSILCLSEKKNLAVVVLFNHHDPQENPLTAAGYLIADLLNK
ncbi:serine hydrolase domain-containing protein [Larkinella soli]|uniref:serine hydrolase domain-containing protein n=1 Tax=Larkinella soli TaxID=1770527 RepID=UPI000FFC886C|nr:serine hydrolase domain-containing protein [Larkinella soli]